MTRARRTLAVAAILLAGLALKGALLRTSAVSFDSDEAVVALMARHILAGERPITGHERIEREVGRDEPAGRAGHVVGDHDRSAPVGESLADLLERCMQCSVELSGQCPGIAGRTSQGLRPPQALSYATENAGNGPAGRGASTMQPLYRDP